MIDIATQNKHEELIKFMQIADDTLCLAVKGFCVMYGGDKYDYTTEYCRAVSVLEEARKNYIIAKQRLQDFEDKENN